MLNRSRTANRDALAALLAQSYDDRYDFFNPFAATNWPFLAPTFEGAFPGFRTASHYQRNLLQAAPSESRVLAVWRKGRQVLGADQALWRLDVYGNWILFAQYGNRNSEYGWEIDHIWPDALGGPDELWNLRPLHWRTNARRQLAQGLGR